MQIHQINYSNLNAYDFTRSAFSQIALYIYIIETSFYALNSRNVFIIMYFTFVHSVQSTV